MEVSVSITTPEKDVIRLSLSSIDKNILPDNIIETLGNIEILDVVLERTYGNNTIPLRTLMKIAEIINGIMKENENAMLYFYCDDMHDIERRNKSTSPQQYRSNLFSKMHERYIIENNITNIMNLPIILKADRDIYIHLIAREKHLPIANKIKHYLLDLAIK